MSLMSRFFGRENPNIVMQPLYRGIIAAGRHPDWYHKGAVPDTIDGRFDMIAALLTLVLNRLEQEQDSGQPIAWLVELFISDMDGQLRQIGIGDMVVGKHMGRMMSMLGGRQGAFRSAGDDLEKMRETVTRNIYRGEAPDAAKVDLLVDALARFRRSLHSFSVDDIMSGKIPDVTL